MLNELATGFSIGILATLSPCALPLYPGFLAYLAAGSERLGGGAVRWLGAAVLAGVLTTMLALGALVAALSLAVGRALSVVTPAADLVVIALGIVLLLGRNPFAKLPTLGTSLRGRGGPIASAYLYGLLYGPITFPCSGALVVGIFSLSVSIASFAQKLLFFLAFGLGIGLPLLALSLLAPARRSALLRAFADRYALVSRLAGIVLIGVGATDLWTNLPFALLYLSS